MYSLKDVLISLYIDKYFFEKNEEFILNLYPQKNLSSNFRMTIREIKTLRNYNQISGLVLSGTIQPGQRVKALPSGAITEVIEISDDGALPGEYITLTVTQLANITCTGMLGGVQCPPQCASLFRVHIMWVPLEKPIPGRRYTFMFGRQRVPGTIMRIKHYDKQKNIYICDIDIEESIAFDPVKDNLVSGTFIIDSEDRKHFLGLGVIEYALRRGENIHRQFIGISKQSRAALNEQQPCVLWLTGLSGAGKSSIANAVEKRLHKAGYHTYILDGDNIRHGLNRDLGFKEEDRVENIRRVAEVAHLMVDAGLIVITSFISPFRADRAMARSLFAKEEFLEVFIDTPLAVAESRDTKGLYAKARRGELKNFTGIDSAYEKPQQPEIRITTTDCTIDEAAEQIITELRMRGIITK